MIITLPYITEFEMILCKYTLYYCLYLYYHIIVIILYYFIIISYIIVLYCVYINYYIYCYMNIHYYIVYVKLLYFFIHRSGKDHLSQPNVCPIKSQRFYPKIFLPKDLWVTFSNSVETD